jgi:hypothetical protein
VLLASSPCAACIGGLTEAPQAFRLRPPGGENVLGGVYVAIVHRYLDFFDGMFPYLLLIWRF